VTQDNQGKNTPGIDGVASLEPEERLNLLAAAKSVYAMTAATIADAL
jgi:hypothetical protein